MARRVRTGRATSKPSLVSVRSPCFRLRGAGENQLPPDQDAERNGSQRPRGSPVGIISLRAGAVVANASHHGSNRHSTVQAESGRVEADIGPPCGHTGLGWTRAGAAVADPANGAVLCPMAPTRGVKEPPDEHIGTASAT
jgi:hypothetical protein